ncbi:unnamed protein product [Caenorhabditis bovis]|uniref:Cadherin domain-containing protein n=1 Tax=Caenorhabditis bovis TaxID=2654633 RepID=A0A8S1EN45_9PELO|nr:unnamed protein product [Caenorhabditis bovis]
MTICNFYLLSLLLLLLLLLNDCESSSRLVVPESAPIGHVIGYVAGKPEQSQIPRYFVVFPDEQTSKFIKVDERSGEITTIAHLDYEKRAKFEIVAVKVDNDGETIDVSIEVEDENDNSPSFAHENIKLNISEFAQLGSAFPLPVVTDGDGPNYDVHRFAILHGNVNNVFKVVSRRVNDQLQADLVVNGQLDREFRDKYELVVEAEDGGRPPRVGQCRVQIEILDANDNAPIFEKSRYSTTIAANTSIGTTIVVVRASDADIGDNSRIRYEIRKTASPSNGFFEISPETGVVRSVGHLLPASMHDVIVVATDHGTPALSSSAIVSVSVLGATLSAPPIDVIWLVESSLMENATIGSIVARASIADEYRDTRLKLIGCPVICPQQTDKSHVYLLLLCGILDRETTDEYHMKFVLEKDGHVIIEHPMLLTIGDVNDNAPQWHNRQIHISLNRTQGGARTLTAKDPDLGQNGWVRYSVLDTDLVAIDKETGRVYVPKAIDCDVGPEIKFRIRAEDGGNPPLFSDLQVFADLVDAESQPPQFVKPLWRVEIPEDTPIGTCIVKVRLF